MLETFPAVAAILFTLGTATGALGLRLSDAIRQRRAADSAAVRWRCDRGNLGTLIKFAERAPPCNPAKPSAACVLVADGPFSNGQALLDTPPHRPWEAPAAADLYAAAGVQGGDRTTADNEIAPRRRTKGEPATFPAEEHAAALLEWVMRDGGIAGQTVSAVDLIDVYRNMCAERDWAERPWQPVAVAFMRLTGIAKRYEWRGKNRVRVYDIPRPAPEANSSNQVQMRAAA